MYVCMYVYVCVCVCVFSVIIRIMTNIFANETYESFWVLSNADKQNVELCH